MAHRALTLTSLALMLLASRPADACGGFFCGQQPIDQSGEHLLFAVEEGEDGQRTIVANIQVQYQGPAEEFAWILPLPAAPEDIAVGSNAIFPTLRALTEPSYTINWLPDAGICGDDGGGGTLRGAGPSAADFDSEGAEGEGEDPDVLVLQQAAVGPYETVVVQSDDSEALIDWLETNDYTVPDGSRAPIQAYVNAHHVFLALKLQKDRSTGDITPIVVRFPEAGPCIPLLMTAIAATPDMPIYAWVLADTGIVSVGNFFEVQVNDAAVSWFSSGRNYRAVATAAVNEAGGRGFLREYAGPTSIFAGQVFAPERFDLDQLRGTGSPEAAVNWALGRFPLDGTMLALLREFVPMPQELVDQGIDELTYYSCMSCWGAPSAEDFDLDGFAAALDDGFVAPLRDAQELLDGHPYVTRLFTTISPDEMTEDPLFRMNPDVPDVENVHVATAQRLCGFGRDRETAPIRLMLPDGRVIVVGPDDPGHPGGPNLVDDDGDGIDDRTQQAPDFMPALARALRHGESGPGDTVLDNRGEIEDALDDVYGAGGGGVCGVVPARTTPSLAALLGLAMLALGLRRRR